MRKTFEETIKTLRGAGLIYDDQSPRIPEAMPKYDDEDPCGFSVFRMGVEEIDLSNLEMPRTFFNKSEITGCNFSNTNLQESNLTWNDFIETNFSSSDLSSSDLRASIYEKVDFSNSNLSNADLRRSDFNNCNFNSANLTGAKISKAAVAVLTLSPDQKKSIDWQETDGDEPSGG